MSTPAGMRHIPFRGENGDVVHIYSDSTRIFLQLRHETPTGSADQDILTASFKAAVLLNDSAALAIASELISIVVGRQKASAANQDETPE